MLGGFSGLFGKIITNPLCITLPVIVVGWRLVFWKINFIVFYRIFCWMCQLDDIYMLVMWYIGWMLMFFGKVIWCVSENERKWWVERKSVKNACFTMVWRPECKWAGRGENEGCRCTITFQFQGQKFHTAADDEEGGIFVKPRCWAHSAFTLLQILIDGPSRVPGLYLTIQDDLCYHGLGGVRLEKIMRVVGALCKVTNKKFTHRHSSTTSPINNLQQLQFAQDGV